MKYWFYLFFLVFLIFPEHYYAQNDCDNLGFASGEIDEWDFFVGCHPNAIPFAGRGYCHVDGGPGETQGCCPTAQYASQGTNASVFNQQARHTLCGGVGNTDVDVHGAFPVVPPQLAGYKKSNFSLRLGNAVEYGEADRFSRTFEINEDNAIFAYHFAFVLNDPADDRHTGDPMYPELANLPYNGLPFFEAKVMNEAGDTIPCSSLLVRADDKSFDSTDVGGEVVRFKAWTPIFLNLEKYIGQTLTLEFTNADCARSGHWGYSYVSAYCGPYVPMQDLTLCINDTATLTSPFPIEGFDLLWSTGETTETIKVLADEDKTITLTVRNKTPIGKMASCPEEYEVNIKVGSGPPPILENDTICPGESVVLTAEPQGIDYHWYDVPAGGNLINTGDSYDTGPIFDDVTYYVMNPAKCADDEKVPVTVKVIKVTATADPETVICKGGEVQLIATGGDIYNWSPTNSLDNPSIPNPKANPVVTTTYTVTVTDSQGRCPATDTITVRVEEIKANLEGVNVCIGEETVFKNLTIPGNVGGEWFWDFGDNSTSKEREPTHLYKSPGKYLVNLRVVSGTCESTEEIEVEVFPNPVAAFTPTPRKTTADDPTITFSDECELAVRGEWDFGDGQVQPYVPGDNPVHLYYATNEGEGPFKYTIKLSVVSENGCPAEVVDEIEIENIWTIYVPNSFTPNGDGINDYFKAYGIGIMDFRMTVFNRWGEVVYRSTDINKGWDGTPISGSNLKQDVYVWKIKAQNNRGKIIRLIGHVSLLPTGEE